LLLVVGFKSRFEFEVCLMFRGLEIGFVKEKGKKRKKKKATAANRSRPTYSLQPSAAQLHSPQPRAAR
jgi:hypothetical protein